MTKIDKAGLRRTLLEQRRSLDGKARQQLSARIADHVCQFSAFVASRLIAAYLPIGNEVDSSPVVATAWAQGKTVVLPVIERSGAMQFFPCAATTPLRRNFFGIDEPATQGEVPVPAAQIDLLLLPLVGFDAHGNRLGMGGGYYDRYFAERSKSKAQQSTTLLGMAYDFQRLKEIPADEWDVPLDGVATESGVELF